MLSINEEHRKNCEFIPRNSSMIETESHFERNPLLEALLVTENGKTNEKLLGIITRWDIL
jgi:CBS domain-containing protein